MSKTLRIGIDLGGTKIHAVALDQRWKVRGTARDETRPDRGYASVLERLHGAAHDAVKDAGGRLKQVRSIGLAVPGPVEPRSGRILMGANLGWPKPRPIAGDLGRMLDRRVVLGNDANFGALGEAERGAGHGAKSVLGVFVGTGLGAGLVQKGRVVNGAHGYAGELGHVAAPVGDALCGCGRRGCLETVASRTGIVRLAKLNRSRGMRCLLPTTGKLKSSHLREALLAGCPATTKAIDEAVRGLAWGLATAGTILDPEVFVLGGGVMEAMGRELLPRLAKTMPEFSVLYRRHRPVLRLAELGDDAVATGAAVAAADEEG